MMFYRLIIEPDFVAGQSKGDIWIDVVKDTDELLPIVLDITNITITNASGKFIHNFMQVFL